MRAAVRLWAERVCVALLAEAPQLVVVPHARDAGLWPLVRRLWQEFPQLEVTTDVRRLGEASPGSVLLVRPESKDGPWLARFAGRWRERGLRVLLWLPDDAVIAMAQAAPESLQGIDEALACPLQVPEQVAGALRKGARSPGIVWEDGPLLECLCVAFPRVQVCWLDARAEYQGLLEDIRGVAPHVWIGFSGLVGEVQVRRLRWALAEAERRGRVIALSPRGNLPGWFPAQARTQDLEAAILVLSRAGARCPGLLAAMSGLEPEIVELLGRLLQAGVPEHELLNQVAAGEDPAVGVARLGLLHGLVTHDGVACGDASSGILRVLNADVDVRRIRQRRTAQVWKAVRLGHEADPKRVACWSAGALSVADADIIDRGRGPALPWMVEAGLRHRPRDAETWCALASAALRLGDLPVAAHWAAVANALPGGSQSRARCRFTLSRVERLQDHPERAEALLREALALLADEGEHAVPLRLDILNGLGCVLAEQGRCNEAEGVLSEALESATRQLGREHADTTVLRQSLGEVALRQGRAEQARAVLARVVAQQTSALGSQHLATGAAWNALGRALAALGEEDGALEALQHDLSINRQAWGDDHPSVARILDSLGQVLLRLGRADDALLCFQREVSILEQVLGTEGAGLVGALIETGRCLRILNRHLDGFDCFKRALFILRAHEGPKHPRVADVLHLQGLTLMALGDAASARTHLMEALEIRRASLGDTHLACALTWHALGQALRSGGDQLAALNAYQQSLLIKQGLLGPEHSETAVTAFEWGRLRLEMDDQAAWPEVRAAYSVLERAWGYGDSRLHQARDSLPAPGLG